MGFFYKILKLLRIIFKPKSETIFNPYKLELFRYSVSIPTSGVVEGFATCSSTYHVFKKSHLYFFRFRKDLNIFLLQYPDCMLFTPVTPDDFYSHFTIYTLEFY